MTRSKTPLDHALARVAGAIILLLGGVVLFGWHARLPAVIQIHPHWVPMQYNTALGFLLAGIGLLAASQCHRRLALVAGGLVGLIGITALIEYSSGANFGVDQLFMEHYITVGTSHPGRMSPNAALCFTLTGITLMLASLEHRGIGYWGTIVLVATLVVGLGATALIGYMAGVQPAYGWGNLTRMAAHSALGFTILGGGLIALVWERTGGEWLAWITGVLSITVSVAVWQALEASSKGPANNLMLAFGLTMTLALIHVIRGAQRTRELNRDFVTILENTSDFIYFKDENSRMQFCSQTLANITGHSSWRDMIGKHDLEIFPEATARLYVEEELAIFRDGVSLLNKTNPYYDAEGKLGWVSTNKWPIISKAGKVVGLFGISRDITERKQAETALRESQEWQRNLIETTSDWVWEVDRSGIYVYASAKVHDVLGYTPDEIIGKTPFDLMPPEEAVRVAQEFGRIAAACLPILSFENINRHKNGKTIVLETSGVPLLDADGNLLGYRGMDRDITERKRVEAELKQYHHHLEELVQSRTAELSQARDDAEAANRAKSAFLATISHELRTPMNGIMGMTDLALRRATDPKLIDWLKKSQGAAKHLLDVINDILDISRIESDRLTLEEADFSLAEAIGDVRSMLDAPAQAKGLRLSWHIDPALPRQLCGDAMRLRQILLSFTNNAIKFSDCGQITIRASVAEEDRVSVLLKIEVTDQGIGISPEQQARLFNAFTQADGSMNRKYGGTGLGLIISKRIALLMGGDAGVISQEGSGSTFWATLRLRRAATVQPVATKETAEPAREALARLFPGTRVLVAEDEPINREVITIQLEDAGLAPVLAKDGRQALDMARGGGYAMILMDVQMPVMNGLEATRAIRQLPGMAKIPILALTANAYDEDRDACLAAGMDAHIGKPVAPDALFETVLRWLRKSDALEPIRPESWATAMANREANKGSNRDPNLVGRAI